MITILIMETKNTPSHGRKNGNKAMEERRVAIMRFIGVILNIYSKRMERMKCQNAMKKVAEIRSVIDETS